MRVVIVGAGLSGLTLAAFLRQINIDVVVLDKSPYLQYNYIEPYVLYANAISCFKAFRISNILEHCSLRSNKLDEVWSDNCDFEEERCIELTSAFWRRGSSAEKRSGTPLYLLEKYFGLMDNHRRWLLRVPNKEIHLKALQSDDIIPLTTSPCANSTCAVSREEQTKLLFEMGQVPLRLTLPASDVRESLRRQVVEMRFGCRVVDLIPHDGVKGGVQVVLEDGRTEWGDIVVGADGMDSTIRRLLYPDEHVHTTSNVLGETHIHGYVDLPVSFLNKSANATRTLKESTSSFLEHQQNSYEEQEQEQEREIRARSKNKEQNARRHLHNEEIEQKMNYSKEVKKKFDMPESRSNNVTDEFHENLFDLYRELKWPVELWGNQKMISLHSHLHREVMRICFTTFSCSREHSLIVSNNWINNSKEDEHECAKGNCARRDGVNAVNVRSLLGDTFKSFGEDMTHLLENATFAKQFEMLEVPILPRWYNKRAVLIGDAAHGSLPSCLQQDASLCVEDAAILATVLADIPFLRDSGVEYVFERYETIRRARIEQYIRQSRRARQLMTTSHVNTRNAFLRLLPGSIFIFLQRWLSEWTYSAQKADVGVAIKNEIFMR